MVIADVTEAKNKFALTGLAIRLSAFYSLPVMRLGAYQANASLFGLGDDAIVAVLCGQLGHDMQARFVAWNLAWNLYGIERICGDLAEAFD